MSRSRKSKPKGTQTNFGSFLVNWGARLAFLIIIIILVLSLAQCTVKKPEAPEWNTQLTVPLVNRTYRMPEIVSKIDQDGIYMDADSNVMYSFSRQLDTFAIDDGNFTIQPLSCDANGQLGAITLDAPNVAPAIVSIGSISGLPESYPAVVPPAAFDVPVAFSPLTDITSATIDQGRCYFVVTNSLGIDIDAATVTINDLGLGVPIASQAFAGGISANESDSVLLLLDGKSISNRLAAVVACHTPGGVIKDPAGHNLTSAVHFPADLQVSSAVATIPALNRTYDDTVSLQETNIITNAAIEQGTVQFAVTNNSELPATVTITVPDIEHNGTPLTIVRPVTANSTVNASTNLANYELVPNDVTSPQRLPVQIAVSSVGSGGSQVSITETNSFDVSLSLQSLQFESVTGIFSSLTAPIDPVVRDIEVPQGFDSLQFTHAVLTLEIENSMSMPGQLDVTLLGNNGKSLQVNGQVNGRSLATAATTVIVEPNVAPFFSPLPSQVTVSGSASFGSGMVGTIRKGDYITGRLAIEAPLELVIKRTPIETDIESEEIDQENIEDITNHVVEGRFVYNVTNHLPIGASVNIVVSPDSATLYSNPRLQFTDIAVEAAPVTSAIVSDTLSTGYQTISISNEDLQILTNDTLYIGYELVLHDSNGQPVRLTKNDYLSIVGRIEVEYHVGDNE